MDNLLIIFESPIYRCNNEYFYEEVWFDFISKTFTKNNKVTVACFIKDEIKINENYLKIANQNIDFVNIGEYRSFGSFLSYILKHPIKFLITVKSLIKINDKIITRCPSPSLIFFVILNYIYKKKFIIFLVGDVYSQSEKIMNSKSYKNLIYKTLGNILVFLEKISLNKVDLIYAYNSFLLSRHKRSTAKKILTLTPRFKIEEIYFREDTCTNQTISLLRVCWLLPSKKIENLILSLKTLKENFDIRLLIVGKAKDDLYFRKLLQLVKNNNLEKNISFLGWKNTLELKEIYKESDINLISSEAEGIPRVMLEGFNYGLPLVSNRIVGITDRLKNYENVIYYDKDDPIDIANSITIMIKNGEIRKKIIKNNYVMSKENSIDRISNKINQTIKNL